ncbi:MAG TPA: hypothetical protein VIV57_24230 [Anaeromyxobacter sp.]
MRSPAALLLAVPLAFASTARAGSPPADAPARDAVGAEIDLLPAALSAADGEAGGAFQLWAGRGRNRLRLVTALVHFPDALTDAPFRDRDLTVAALICDRFFRDGFRGPWLGAGLELWWTGIGTELGPGRRERANPVATAGGGWVFPIWRGLYLNPWAAGHLVLGNREIRLPAATYRMRAVEGEVSLKVGWTQAL